MTLRLVPSIIKLQRNFSRCDFGTIMCRFSRLSQCLPVTHKPCNAKAASHCPWFHGPGPEFIRLAPQVYTWGAAPERTALFPCNGATALARATRPVQPQPVGSQQRLLILTYNGKLLVKLSWQNMSQTNIIDYFACVLSDGTLYVRFEKKKSLVIYIPRYLYVSVAVVLVKEFVQKSTRQTLM